MAKRDWGGEEFVYLKYWADGIYVNVRGEERQYCLNHNGLTNIAVAASAWPGPGGLFSVNRKSCLRRCYQSFPSSWVMPCIIQWRFTREAGVVVGPGRSVSRDHGLASLLGDQDGERSRQSTAQTEFSAPKRSRCYRIWGSTSRASAKVRSSASKAIWEAKLSKVRRMPVARDRDDFIAFYDFPALFWGHLQRC